MDECAILRKHVAPLTRRLVSLACVLAFAQGAWAQCAGWQRSAVARKACCGACPTSDRDASHRDHGATQQQADACCAASEPRPSETPVAPPPSSFDGLVAAREPIGHAVTAAAFSRILPFVHLRTSPVPKHLLLSVFLV